ncbi:MAG: hypothetical protein, partial [Olavius algarvensis Gamma 1 endosymbiont]
GKAGSDPETIRCGRTLFPWYQSPPSCCGSRPEYRRRLMADYTFIL